MGVMRNTCFFPLQEKQLPPSIHPSMGSPYSLFHPERGRSCFMLCKIPHRRQDFQAKKKAPIGPCVIEAKINFYTSTFSQSMLQGKGRKQN